MYRNTADFARRTVPSDSEKLDMCTLNIFQGLFGEAYEGLKFGEIKLLPIVREQRNGSVGPLLYDKWRNQRTILGLLEIPSDF